MVRLLLSSVGVVAFATAAAAQEASPAPAQSPAAPSAAHDEGALNEIVVTATRHIETVQRVAVPIQALSSEDLTRANVSRPEDISSIAPGVQIGTSGSFPQAYVRGVGNYSVQAFAEGAVSFNLDGVYISRGWATRGMFYDLDRVEVVEGPQGTLYGRNSSGGAINVITARPKLGSMSGFAELEAGNYNLKQGTAALNLPLGETVALRVSGQVVNRSGYLTNGYDDDKTQSSRVQLLWAPNDDFSLLLNSNYQHAGGKGSGEVLSPQLPGNPFRDTSDPAVTAIIQAQPGIGQFLTYPKNDGFLDDTVYTGGAELNWNLGFATLTALPAYRDSTLRDLTYAPAFSVQNYEHDKQTSLEIRLGNDSEKLKWVLGGYYFNERDTNLSGDKALIVLQGVNAQVVPQMDLQTRSYAAFGQATYSLTDRFRLTGGLRYTYEHKRLDQMILYYSFPNFAPPPCSGGAVFDPATVEIPLFCRAQIPQDGTLSYNSVTYKAGVEYDLAPRSMAYANVSTGFKSGGFFTAPPPNSFHPEKLTAFDVGVKNRFLDNRLQVNVEGFYWDYRDHQESFTGPTSVPGFFTFVTVNAGRAKSYGADLDVRFLATPRDELSLKTQYDKSNYGVFKFLYLSAVFGSPVTSCQVGPLQNSGSQEVDCGGKPLVRAPQWSGTAAYSHTFGLGEHGDLTASLGAQFASAAYLSIDFLPAAEQGAYAIGNFDLTYKSNTGRWVLTSFVHNLTNEVVRNQAFRDPFVGPADPLADPQGVILTTIRPPRTFGGRVRFNF
jgi:iron complex outermembrane recepter protein